MPRRINAADHVGSKWLAEVAGVGTSDAESFRRAFFHVIETALRDDQMVILPGVVCGPEKHRKPLVALDARLANDSPALWTLCGEEIAGRLGLTAWDASSIATLADLIPEILRKLVQLGAAISDRAFVALLRATTGELEAAREHLTFDLNPVDREASIEDWVVDNLADIGALMEMPSLDVYRTSTGPSGRQWRFANGRRADLVCRTTKDSDRIPSGTWLVIELKAGYGIPVDVDQINEYVELIIEELADPNDWVLGCLIADGFHPEVADYIREAHAPVFPQTLTAIGFHDDRFAYAAIAGLSYRGTNDANESIR